MMNLILGLFLTLSFFSVAHAEVQSFDIIILDRKIQVVSPDKKKDTFSVRVDNRSLANLIGKFHAGGKDLQYISVKSLSQKVVEIQNKTKKSVTYTQLTPAFQDVVLEFGKSTYEIPKEK